MCVCGGGKGGKRRDGNGSAIWRDFKREAPLQNAGVFAMCVHEENIGGRDGAAMGEAETKVGIGFLFLIR